jgi:3D (Asp-Asp-Asp) domain-containing protein
MKFVILLALTSTALFGLYCDEKQIATLQQQLSAAQVELHETKLELSRCDEIMQMVFSEWDRTKPVFTKPVTVTSYTSTPQQCDSDPHINASNQYVRPGTIAVSRDLLEQLGGFGSKVVLMGYGTFEVADVMNKRFSNSVDIWMGDRTAALLHGRQTTEILWQ